MWQVKGGEDACCSHVLRGHTKALSFVAWSPDDTLLLTCGNDELVKLWDTDTGECLRTYNKHTMVGCGAVGCAAFCVRWKRRWEWEGEAGIGVVGDRKR